ncbi:hypothetical protein [Streptomyces sp. NBC_01451]|uniref:hypothetical protein n=1 Tax=Streptomyces sp. NBC_01451 TaxID=2903872 RepID=UPI002E322E78|nr:hypothetical protein [Streptomyces sp. NBC_01451]
MRGVPCDGTRPLTRSSKNSSRSRSTSPPGRRPRARHARHAVAGAALLLLAAGAAPAFGASAGGADSPERDARLVYCLDPVHRTDLLTAAVRLGLLKADAEVSPERWAKDHDDDFGRACAALMAAESDSPAAAAQSGGADGDGWLMTLVKQLPLLLAGALLTLGGQSYERVSSQRRSLRQELGTAESAYRAAVREYTTEHARETPADHPPVRAARDALFVALSRVPGPAARRAAAEELADGLPLAEPLPRTGAYLFDRETRVRDAAEEHASAQRCLRSLSELNRGSLYWGWRTLRSRSARTGTAGGAE